MLNAFAHLTDKHYVTFSHARSQLLFFARFLRVNGLNIEHLQQSFIITIKYPAFS